MPSLLSSLQSYLFPSFNWIPSSKQHHSLEESTLHGKLLLENEVELSQHEKDRLLEQEYAQRVPAIEHYPWGYRCRRCGNRTQRHFATCPCHNCPTKCVYCRNCIQMGRITSCTHFLVWTGSPPEFTPPPKILHWQGELTSFQQKGSTQITKAIQSKTSLLVWAVCGAGKTEMLFEGIAHALASQEKICIATPRTDVVKELLPRMQSAFPEITIAALYGGSEQKDEGAQLILSTTHQLLRYARAFDVLIIDEVDAFPYYADRSLWWASQRAKKESASTIYLTATPRFKYKLLSKIGKLPAVFVPQRYHGHPLPVPRFQTCFGWKKTLQRNRPPKKLQNWLDEKRSRRILIFTPTIKLAEEMAELIPDSVVVHSEDELRSQKVQQFRDKEIRLLITTAILERGVTFPSIDVAVFDAGHRNFDEAALVQIAGRAGRSTSDPDGDVVFFHDGKSDAMINARDSIRTMNTRARKGGR